MKYSKYQQAIFDVYENTNKNIFIDASAGVGKTFILLELLKRTPKNKKVLFVAFNKSIQEEISNRLPKDAKNVEVKTLHSKGFQILRSNIRMNVKVNENKNFIFCQEQIKSGKLTLSSKKYSYIQQISDIINFVKLNLTPHAEAEIIKMCDKFGLLYTKEHIYDTIQVLKNMERWEKNLNTKSPKYIDYTDMLYLPITKVPEKKFPKYDVVMFDENQDSDILQQQLVLNMLKPNSRLITAGDKKQSIYGFTGASLETFKAFQNRENTVTLELPMTYRCGKKIVEKANEIFPNQTVAFENNSEGEIRDGDISEAVSGDMIVCRNNKPLIKAWIKLTSLNKKAHILGKDFERSLQRLLSKMRSIFDIDNILREKEKELSSYGIVNVKAHKSYQDLQEKLDIIKMLYDELGDLKTVSYTISKIFIENGKDDEGIKMSTIHKAKGLEADRCFILNWHLIPSKFAFTDLDFYNEKCLQYVAITRAKNELIFADI